MMDRMRQYILSIMAILLFFAGAVAFGGSYSMRLEKDSPVHKAQVLTYLRLTGLKLGLVVNFGQGRLIDGLCRVANGL
jgi:hypothetical protein